MSDAPALIEAAPPMLRDGEMVDAYEILFRIGVGGMGEVYKAEHTGLHKTVALKMLSTDVSDRDARARFLREGKLASKIQHPNIVDVTDVGEHDGKPYLVMEFLDGEPLSKALKRTTRFSVEEAVDILVPVSAAIAAAHALGVVHRDIKPENVFMTRSALGEVLPKVVDFGISKAIEDQAAPVITATHAFVGTPHYMSPEQAQGARRATALSDQYSLGVMFYELISGVRPFDEPSFLRLVHAIARGSSVPLKHVRPDVDPKVHVIIERAMALDPDQRFESVRAFAEAMLPHASPRTRTLWEPRLEGLSDPVSQLALSVTNPGTTASGSSPSIARVTAATVSASSGERPINYDTATRQTTLADRGGMDTVAAAVLRDGIAASPNHRGRWTRWLAAGALLLLGGTAAVYVLPAPPAPIAVGAAAPEAEAPTFSVSLAVQPSSARILLDGHEVGSGNFSGLLPRDGVLHRFHIEAEGYHPRTLSFRDVPPPAEVTMTPLSEPAPIVPPEPEALPEPLPEPGPQTVRSPGPQPVVVPKPAATAAVATASATPAASATPSSAPTTIVAPVPTTNTAPTSTSTTGNIDPWMEK